MSEHSPTVRKSLDAWLEIRRASKSVHTYAASRRAAQVFEDVVGDIPLPSLTEEHYSRFLESLKEYNARTEQLYATLIYGWFVYLGAKEIKMINLAKLQYARKNEQRRPGARLREFDRPALESLRDQLAKFQVRTDDRIMARARALVLLAIESGLRVSELCRLRAGDLDFERMQGTVVGKRNKERRFPFTRTSASAVRFYLSMRQRLEPERGAGLLPDDVPVFVSHSKRGHSKLRPIDTDTARLDLERVLMVLAIHARKPITPHVLRHFAGNELRKAIGDLEIVRILLGHKSIETTKGYMHVEDEEALEAYHQSFDRRGT